MLRMIYHQTWHSVQKSNAAISIVQHRNPIHVLTAFVDRNILEMYLLKQIQ